MKIAYLEDTDSLIVDLGLHPERKVGCLTTKQLNEQTLVHHDEAGNVAMIEVMNYVSRLYGTDEVEVEGLAARAVPRRWPERMTLEEYEARKNDIRREQTNKVRS